MAGEPNDHSEKPEPSQARIIELRTRSAPCRTRYGRATLTISRRGKLVDHLDLAETIEAYRDGQASAADLAWAFVQARVEKHSPTFSWENADRERLLHLVVECSEEPQFESAEPEAVAQAIVAAHDKETEQLRQIAEMFSRSFANTVNFKDFLPPAYLGWADQQRHTFGAIQRFLGGGQFTQITEQLGGLSKSIVAAQQANVLDAFGQLGKQMQEQQRLAAVGAVALRGPVLGAAFDLRETPLLELSRSLQQTMEAMQIGATTLPTNVFLNREAVTVDEVLGAAEGTAEVMAERGAGQQASELRAVTAEVREVAEHPSPERLEGMISQLTSLVEEEGRQRAEADEELRELIQEEGRKRVEHDAEKLKIEYFLIFLQILVTVFLWLLGAPPIGQ